MCLSGLRSDAYRTRLHSTAALLVWPSRRLLVIDSGLPIWLRMLAVLLPPARAYPVPSRRRYARVCAYYCPSSCSPDPYRKYPALQPASYSVLAAPRTSLSRIRRSSRQNAGQRRCSVLSDLQLFDDYRSTLAADRAARSSIESSCISFPVFAEAHPAPCSVFSRRRAQRRTQLTDKNDHL